MDRAALLLTLALTPVTCAQPTPEPPLTVGMNLAGVVDWSNEWVFTDVFKHSRAWIPQTPGGGGPWDTGVPIRTDDLAWPLLEDGQAAATLMCWDISPHYPGGTYTLTWEGSGTIHAGFGNVGVTDKQPGRMLLDVDSEHGGIYLRIDRSSDADPVRDIRCTMPGFDADDAPTFHPLFLERTAPFPVIRFMDWQATNNSPLEHWEDRTTPEHASQARPQGVALEHMVELCNELGADPWFCMPHKADDEFVRNFAALVKQTLHEDATIYVEYSNEVWNGLFEQHHYAAGIADDTGKQFWEVYCDESARDWEIWLDVFADDKDRIVRVLAGQHYNPWIAQQMAEYLDGDFDAIASGGYFSVRDEDLEAISARPTPERVIDSCLRELEERGIDLLKAHGTLALEWSARTGRDIEFLVYEGGQHLSVWGNTDAPYFEAFKAAQEHPRMREPYEKVMRAFRDAGGDLFMAFSSVSDHSQWGSWGHLRYQDQPLDEAVKYRALLDAQTGALFAPETRRRR